MTNSFFNNDLVDGEVYSASDVEEIETGFDLVEDEFVKYQPVENGFVNRADSIISFVDGTRTFTIQPSSTSFTFFSNGNQHVITEADDLVLSTDSGMHYIFYNVSGNLTESVIWHDSYILNTALIAFVYWNGVESSATTVADERHGIIMDAISHQYLHNTRGTAYSDGLQPIDITPDGDGSLAIHAQIGITLGAIWDEDIKIEIDSDPRPTSIPILYRAGSSSGLWVKIPATDYIITTTGTGRAAYNEWTGATWQLAEISNGRYMLMHLYATNDIDDNFFFIVGENEYLNVTSARSGALDEISTIEYGRLPITEYKSIASFIIQTNDSYANSVKSVIRTTDTGGDYVDWRFTSAGIALSVSGATSSIWGGITGTIADQTDLQTELDAKIAQGLHTIWIPASAMISNETNGAEYAELELATNDVMIAAMDFDATTSESIQFQVRMPKSWDEETILFAASWSHAATTTNFGVVWSLSGNANSDGDALDSAFGTEIDIENTGGTTDDLYISSRSSAVTIAGTPAAEDIIVFKINRDVAHASDDMAIDARLHGVTLYYTIDAEDDT